MTRPVIILKKYFKKMDILLALKLLKEPVSYRRLAHFMKKIGMKSKPDFIKECFDDLCRDGYVLRIESEQSRRFLFCLNNDREFPEMKNARDFLNLVREGEKPT